MVLKRSFETKISSVRYQEVHTMNELSVANPEAIQSYAETDFKD